MRVTITAAKANLSKLIKAAHAGDEVVITRRGVPVAKLEPVMVKRAFKFGVTETPWSAAAQRANTNS